MNDKARIMNIKIAKVDEKVQKFFKEKELSKDLGNERKRLKNEDLEMLRE